MSHRGRSNSSYRGRGGRGVISQIGNQRLIAENIANLASSSSSNTLGNNDQKLYQEFLKFKEQRQGNTQPSYAHIANEGNEPDNKFQEQNSYKELILLLEDKDLRWKDDKWHLMQRYLDIASFTAGSYKQRTHYENILKITNSCEITHFPGTEKAHSFSKVIIKQIISAEEWGMSTLREKEYYPSEQKIAVKFNYWDYMDAFHKAFLYQNPRKTHTWWLKICPNVYNRDIPNWLYQWWLIFGTSVNILPEPYKGLYNEWVKISPKLIDAEHENLWIEGMPSLHFFAEFGIPWVWKWEPEVGHTQQNIPCLRRVTFTRFWKRMLQNNEEGILEGQETIDQIQATILKYKEQIKLKQQRESPSPFQQISRRLKLQNSSISKREIMTSFLNEMKQDLIKNFEEDMLSDASMATSSKEDDQEDAQDPYADEADVSIEELFKNVDELIAIAKPIKTSDKNLVKRDPTGK